MKSMHVEVMARTGFDRPIHYYYYYYKTQTLAVLFAFVRHSLMYQIKQRKTKRIKEFLRTYVQTIKNLNVVFRI